MVDPATFGIFFASALTLAVIPGPGMLYVLARTVRGGRREGILSTLGTGIAGVLHTLAAALVCRQYWRHRRWRLPLSSGWGWPI